MKASLLLPTSENSIINCSLNITNFLLIVDHNFELNVLNRYFSVLGKIDKIVLKKK